MRQKDIAHNIWSKIKQMGGMYLAAGFPVTVFWSKKNNRAQKEDFQLHIFQYVGEWDKKIEKMEREQARK